MQVVAEAPALIRQAGGVAVPIRVVAVAGIPAVARILLAAGAVCIPQPVVGREHIRPVVAVAGRTDRQAGAAHTDRRAVAGHTGRQVAAIRKCLRTTPADREILRWDRP
jgi:hypothetical protein